ncbi:MAG: S41 family peptidase [Planctomycetota bacterium]
MSRWIRLLGLPLFLVLASTATAEDRMWLRYPAISPDGKQVCFSYRGDLWLVDSAGGPARLLTSHAAYERSPVWAPDGQSIAFASDRHGNFDVFIVSATGGTPTRLTHHSANDIPTTFTNDGQQVVFTSGRNDAAESMIGTPAMLELYAVPLAGGRPRQLLTTTAEFANFDPSGNRIVFQDYKGVEDSLRKHHTSSVTRDIWIVDLSNKAYTKLTSFAGEDRNPVWSPDGSSVFYLSEQGGNFNVWKLDPANPSVGPTQISSHPTHPVRFLSIARSGKLCYSWNSEIFTQVPGEQPIKLSITAPADDRLNAVTTQVLRDEATEFAVAPNEEEVAFVVRGEVFVANLEYGTTRRLTNTPEQERSVTWSADGRSVIYAGERDNSWNLYKTSLVREEEDRFSNATLLADEVVLESDDETFQPLVSPDGKKVAYLRNRIELMVLDLETKQSSLLVPGKQNFSYTDGDISYAWSPDSRWLTVTHHAHKSWTPEIGVVELATGKVVNVSESGYDEGSPKFAAGGKALLYISDRFGERSHGSWGSERDIIAFYLTQDSYDEAVLDKEKLELKKKRKSKKDEPAKDAAPEKKEGDKTAADGEKAEKKDKPVEPIAIDFDEPHLRTRRLTMLSAALGDYALTPDGENLIFTAQIDDKWGLWLTKVRERSTAQILSLGDQSPGAIELLKDGKSAVLMQGGGRLVKVDLAPAFGNGGGKATSKPIAFAAEMQIDGPRERDYIFEHAWRQTRHKFYDPKLHGVDWQAMKENYQAYLPSINNNYDFADLLSELLGELNASHTGGRYRPRGQDGDQTAAFGLIYDQNHQDIGLKVAEVIKNGPCDTADCQIKPGVIITHIDGVRLTPDVEPWKLLNRKVDKPIRLGLHDPAGNREWEEVIRPINAGEEGNLLYERWIATRRELCEKISGGRIGYVHVRGMNDASFRRVYSEVLGLNAEKEALIVDTRFNGGGWLHEDLATFLSGKRYCYFAPRDHEKGDLGGEPINKWVRPVAVLQSESNYSDAHFFPWAFKAKGIGKLIGAPVPGTATAVWWETQIDSSIVFGIPQVGMIALDGSYLENQQLEPDVLVYNNPGDVATGKDPQLEKAVEVLLEDLKTTESPK